MLAPERLLSLARGGIVPTYLRTIRYLELEGGEAEYIFMDVKPTSTVFTWELVFVLAVMSHHRRRTG